MAASIKEIREAMAEALRSIGSMNVTPYVVGGSAHTPAAWMLPGPIDYDQAGSRGLDFQTVLVQVLVASQDQASQEMLDRYMEPDGPESIKEVLETDENLKTVVQDLHVQSCSGYQRVERQSGMALICEWRVRVLP